MARLINIATLLFVVCFSLFFPEVSVGQTAVEEHAGAESKTSNNYKGWAVLKRNIVDDQAKDDEWISIRDVKMSDSGTKLRIKDGEKDTPYTIELIEITYTQTDTTVLKLALYEDSKDKAITYIWGEPGAGRLGMNLRWMQVGLTKI